jgi:hypothetical protein
MSDDSYIHLSKVFAYLSQAYNAHRAAEFNKTFAAKQMPELTDEQRQMRLTILRMSGQLVDTEFEDAMDKLTQAWTAYQRG